MRDQFPRPAKTPIAALAKARAALGGGLADVALVEKASRVTSKRRPCSKCGKDYLPTGNRQQFCTNCKPAKKPKDSTPMKADRVRPEPQAPVNKQPRAPATQAAGGGRPDTPPPVTPGIEPLEIRPSRGVSAQLAEHFTGCAITQDSHRIELDPMSAAQVYEWLGRAIEHWRAQL